jgi:phage terminase small subunit
MSATRKKTVAKEPAKRYPEAPLSLKQIAFVDEYMKDRNATQAAIRADYSEKTARQIGCRLLTNVHIRAEVAKRTEEYTRTAGLTAQWALERIKRIADADLRKCFDDKGNLLDATEWPDDVAGAIAGMDVTEEFSGTGSGRALTGYTKKIKLWDKLGALRIILEYLKAIPVAPAQGSVTNVQVNVDKLIVALDATPVPA